MQNTTGRSAGNLVGAGLPAGHAVGARRNASSSVRAANSRPGGWCPRGGRATPPAVPRCDTASRSSNCVWRARSRQRFEFAYASARASAGRPPRPAGSRQNAKLCPFSPLAASASSSELGPGSATTRNAGAVCRLDQCRSRVRQRRAGRPPRSGRCLRRLAPVREAAATHRWKDGGAGAPLPQDEGVRECRSIAGEGRGRRLHRPSSGTRARRF